MTIIAEGERSQRIRSVVEAASRWSDPEHSARVEAVERTLAAPNRFTEEGLAFAINHDMHRLTASNLETWIGAVQSSGCTAVAPAGQVPLDGLTEVLAAYLAGSDVALFPAESDPVLIASFFQEVGDTAELDGGSTPDRWVVSESRKDLAGDAQPQHVLPDRFAVGIVRGDEPADDREGLAQDALLHDGSGPQALRLLFAPRDLDADPYFEAMAHVRAVFPVHPETPGSLEMQRAFLAAADQPHAYGEGLEFLVSRGEPSPQKPGHIRWVEYDDLSEVTEWVRQEREAISCVSCVDGDDVEGALPVPVVPPGQTHRQLPGWYARRSAVIDFLAGDEQVRG